jgi:hypothetical protein
MEEEKGNYLYILFIILGVSLLSVGAFYYFTDSESKNNQENVPSSGEATSKVIVKSSDVKEVGDNTLNSISLKEKEVTIAHTKRGDNLSLDVNGKSVAVINESPDYKVYTVLDEFLLFELHTNNAFNHFYLVNSEGRVVKEIYEMTNGTYVSKFEEDSFTSNRIIDGNNMVLYNNRSYNICEPGNSLPGDLVVISKYNLVRYDSGSFGLEFVNGSGVTLLEAQSSICN